MSFTAFLFYLFLFGNLHAEPASPDCDLNGSAQFGCHNIGNIIIGPKGLKRIFDEKVNNPEFKKSIREQLAKSVKAMPKQVWYKTPNKCKSVKTGEFAKSFLLKKSIPVSDGCILAPLLEPNGKVSANTQAVPIELATENFMLDEENFEFDLTDPICQKGQCRTQIQLKKVSLISDFTIRTAEGTLLSGPSYRIQMSPGENKKSLPATLDAYIFLREGGKLDSATADFKELKVNHEAFSLEQVIRQNGKVFEMSDLNTPESSSDSKAQIARKRELESQRNKYLYNYQCEAVTQLLSSANAEEEYKNQFMEYKKKRQRRSNLSKIDQEELIQGLEYVRRHRSSNKKVDCKSIPATVFSSTTSYDEAYDVADAKVAGFRDLQTQWLFDGVVNNVMGQSTLKDEEFISKVVVPEIQKQALGEAHKQLQNSIGELSSTLNPLLEQEFEVPVINLAIQTRKANAVTKIEELVEKLKKVNSRKNQAHDFKLYESAEKELQKRLQQVQKDLEDIEAEELQQNHFHLNTNYIMDMIDGMNRVRIINRKDLCQEGVTIPGSVDGIQKQKEMGDNEFAFEFPISTLQKYIDEMYKKFPYLCTESIKKDCSDGTKINLPNKPKLSCQAGKGCKIDFGTLNTQAMGSPQKFDFSLGANINKCTEKGKDSVCLSFDKAEVGNRDFLIWLHDALPGQSIKGKADEALKQIGEIDIGAILPPDIHQSFSYGKPIIKSNTISLPMNLNSIKDRKILLN